MFNLAAYTIVIALQTSLIQAHFYVVMGFFVYLLGFLCVGCVFFFQVNNHSYKSKGDTTLNEFFLYLKGYALVSFTYSTS